MSIDLTGLTIERLVVHHVYKRDSDKNPRTPRYGEILITLPDDAQDAFQQRITEALGHRSHGVEMAVCDSGEDSFFQAAAKVLHNSSEAEFIEATKQMAHGLAKVQSSKDLAASKLLIMLGRSGLSQTKYLAVIKAELQDGFSADDEEDTISHINDLFLTPTQKLYKIGFLHQIVAEPAGEDGLYSPDKYKVFLFDHLLTSTESKEPAHYFYSEFLGFLQLVSDRKKTKFFYEYTREFINASEVDQEDKVALLEALRSELRNNKAILKTESFAKDYMTDEMKEEYLSYMTNKDFTADAFAKDVEFIKTKLGKRQRMRFNNRVEVSAPADKLHECVKVIEKTNEKTIVSITGTVVDQE